MTDLLDRLPVGHADEHLRPMMLSNAEVTIALQPRAGLILLRGPATEDFQQAVTGALGLELPVEANRVVAVGDLAAFWLRPGGWLLRCAPDRCAAHLSALQDALADLPHLAVDISHQYVAIRITGAGARCLLARSCSLDLEADGFDSSHCARTLLGQVPVIMRPTAVDCGYDLMVEQSLARFVWWRLENDI